MLELSRKQLLSRPDLLTIYELMPENSKILDLGCGEGSLLYLLRKEKNAFGCGVEISQDNILKCVSAGVPVVQCDLNQGLKEFPAKSFDYVILSQTLQAVQRPDELLDEMVRIGENVVISFINFGHYSARLQLMFKGRMPVNESLPTPWYQTLNIHLGTLMDFRDLCASKNLTVIKEIPLNPSGGFLSNLWPNMFAPTCVFLIKKQDQSGTCKE